MSTQKQAQTIGMAAAKRGPQENIEGDPRLAVNMNNVDEWFVLTDEELNELVRKYDELKTQRATEEEVRMNTYGTQVKLIRDTIDMLKDQRFVRNEKYATKKDILTLNAECAVDICHTGLEEYGPEIMTEAWNIYFEENSDDEEEYKDLVELLRRARHENRRSRIHLAKTVYENEGRTRNVLKKLTLCKYHTYKGEIGNINPGGGGYAEGCLANTYGFCPHQHVGEKDWEHSVSLAMSKSDNQYRYPKTEQTGPLVGAGAGSFDPNNRQEIRVWSTTSTVDSRSASGKAHRDRSYNKYNPKVGDTASSTTSSSNGGAGNGNNRMQQQNRVAKGKGNGKNSKKPGFGALREESSEDEE